MVKADPGVVYFSAVCGWFCLISAQAGWQGSCAGSHEVGCGAVSVKLGAREACAWQLFWSLDLMAHTTSCLQQPQAAKYKCNKKSLVVRRLGFCAYRAWQACQLGCLLAHDALIGPTRGLERGTYAAMGFL